LVRTESDYERAIETALGAGIQNIVTETADDAKVAINFLKKHKAGRVTFLPLDILHARSNVDDRILNYRGVVGWAPDLVEANPRYRVVVENLLGNVVITETLDDAIMISRRERTRMRLVTLDGDVVNPGGAMSGGSGRGNNAGFLQRPREIEDLKERIGQLSDTLAKKERRRTQLEQAAVDANRRRAEGQVALQKLQIEKAEAAKDLTQVTEQTERVKQELDVTTSERELLSGEEGDITRERDETKEGLAKLQRERQMLDRRVKALGEQKDATATRRVEIDASVTEMKVDLAGRREKLEGFGAVIENLENNRKDAADRADEFQRAIDNHEEVAKELADKVADAQRSFLMLEQRKFTHAEEVARLESERSELAEEMAERDKELRNVRREADRSTKLRHNLDVQLTRLRMQERSIAERVQEKYRLAIADIQPNPEVGENEVEVNEKVQSLRGQIEAMGAVNLMAIEEYDEHKVRLESLSGDCDDLEHARDALLKAIRKINETSRERFLETFELIRTNFDEVFKQLFGGGDTELKLTDDEDVLDAGIEIIARPPGKRPQNISMLSGGERSLIAIALLFAVFKIRPSPFCVLDEVDAALDEANVLRFANLIQDYAKETQFLIITHNKRTMEKADLLYGVTMEKAGVSKIVSVKFGVDGETEAIA
jgi:chromosome segregation protein